jgi:hypothetical protein
MGILVTMASWNPRDFDQGGGAPDYQPTMAIYPDLRKTQDQGDLGRSSPSTDYTCPSQKGAITIYRALFLVLRSHGALVPDRHPFCTSLRL